MLFFWNMFCNILYLKAILAPSLRHSLNLLLPRMPDRNLMLHNFGTAEANQTNELFQNL